MLTQQLYVVLLGGKHAQANIEVHDLIPVVGVDLESTYSSLKQQWFGLKAGLHVDSWMKIHGVFYHNTSYQILLKETPPQNSALKLFIINLGAYLPNQFGETHKYLLVAGMDKADAKIQGKLAIETAWQKPHTDAIIDVDDCIALDLIDQHYVHIIEGEFEPNIFKNDYVII